MNSLQFNGGQTRVNPYQRALQRQTPLTFRGAISDQLMAETAKARVNNQLAALRKDYGEGVTGKLVIALIVELIDESNAKRKVVYKQEMAKYRQLRDKYDRKPVLLKWVIKKPTKPTLELVKSVLLSSIFNHFSTPHERSGQFEDSPRLDAAQDALNALKSEGLISGGGDLDNHAVFWGLYVHLSDVARERLAQLQAEGQSNSESNEATG